MSQVLALSCQQDRSESHYSDYRKAGAIILSEVFLSWAHVNPGFGLHHWPALASLLLSGQIQERQKGALKLFEGDRQALEIQLSQCCSCNIEQIQHTSYSTLGLNVSKHD